MDTALHCSVKENRGRAQASLFVYLACTDLAFMLCVFYAEPRISRVPISSGRARTISRNLVHSLKAKSVLKINTPFQGKFGTHNYKDKD